MSKDRSLVRPLIDALLPLAGKLARTERAGRLANFPPIAWALRGVGRALLRFAGPLNGQVAAVEERVSGATLQDALDGIVHDVVESLGYLGAMVATGCDMMKKKDDTATTEPKKMSTDSAKSCPMSSCEKAK